MRFSFLFFVLISAQCFAERQPDEYLNITIYNQTQQTCQLQGPVMHGGVLIQSVTNEQLLPGQQHSFRAADDNQNSWTSTGLGPLIEFTYQCSGKQLHFSSLKLASPLTDVSNMRHYVAEGYFLDDYAARPDTGIPGQATWIITSNVR